MEPPPRWPRLQPVNRQKLGPKPIGNNPQSSDLEPGTIEISISECKTTEAPEDAVFTVPV
jgi:hypothetical protein